MSLPTCIEQNTDEQAFRLEVAQHITHALSNLENLVRTDLVRYADEDTNFQRKYGARRKYTLKDAKHDANIAAIALRNAWELLDPITPSPFKR